jgi:hypothetical protein
MNLTIFVIKMILLDKVIVTELVRSYGTRSSLSHFRSLPFYFTMSQPNPIRHPYLSKDNFNNINPFMTTPTYVSLGLWTIFYMHFFCPKLIKFK